MKYVEGYTFIVSRDYLQVQQIAYSFSNMLAIFFSLLEYFGKILISKYCNKVEVTGAP